MTTTLGPVGTQANTTASLSVGLDARGLRRELVTALAMGSSPVWPSTEPGVVGLGHELEVSGIDASPMLTRGATTASQVAGVAIVIQRQAGRNLPDHQRVGESMCPAIQASAGRTMSVDMDSESSISAIVNRSTPRPAVWAFIDISPKSFGISQPPRGLRAKPRGFRHHGSLTRGGPKEK